MFDVDHPAFLTARKSVELLLAMGRESYRLDIIKKQGKYLLVSPLAGQQIETKLKDGMRVGPSEHGTVCYVVMALTCLGRKIQAHCLVSGGGRNSFLVEASVYVDGRDAIRRNVTVKQDGSLEPWVCPTVTRYRVPNPAKTSIAPITMRPAVIGGVHYLL